MHMTCIYRKVFRGMHAALWLLIKGTLEYCSVMKILHCFDLYNCLFPRNSTLHLQMYFIDYLPQMYRIVCLALNSDRYLLYFSVKFKGNDALICYITLIIQQMSIHKLNSKILLFNMLKKKIFKYNEDKNTFKLHPIRLGIHKNFTAKSQSLCNFHLCNEKWEYGYFIMWSLLFYIWLVL